MKRLVLQFSANTCFFIGDIFCRLAFKFDSGTLYDCYQYWMHLSGEIQDKYNLDGPWKKVNDSEI